MSDAGVVTGSSEYRMDLVLNVTPMADPTTWADCT